MCKGCKVYAILELNEKGLTKGLEHLPVVREFADILPRGVTWDAIGEGIGVYHRPKTRD
jgi:hypothetical protein